MKRLLIYSVAVFSGLLILLFLIFFFRCFFWDPPIQDAKPCGKDSLRYIFYNVKTASDSAIVGKEDSIIVVKVAYRCNELITRDLGFQGEMMLRCKGFKPRKKCQCNPKLVLWEAPPGVDPIGAIEDPPPGKKDSSMTLNFVFPDNDSFKTTSDSLQQLVNPPPGSGATTVKVAVVDTGVDLGGSQYSLNLKEFLWVDDGTGMGCPGYPSFPNGLDLPDLSPPNDIHGHGTHCSGIAAGYGSNLSAANIRIELITAKISEDERNSMDLFTATCGIHYALKQGAQVINLSWGYLEEHQANTGTKNHIPYVMLDALQEASDKGVVIVAALGNERTELTPAQRFWPACFSENWRYVISVGALSEPPIPFQIADYSNRFPNSIYAPGTHILSTVPATIWRWDGTPPVLRPLYTKGFAYGTGTSMAAPMVARAVALMLGKHPPAPGQDIKAYLLNNYANGRDLQYAVQNW